MTSPRWIAAGKRRARTGLRLLGLAAAMTVAAAGHFSARAGTGTGKVPIEGALATNNLTPQPGDEVFLYLNATPLEDTATLTLHVMLPEGMAALPGAVTRVAFTNVRADTTVTLAVPAFIATDGPLTVRASATLADSESLALSRAFVLTVNPGPPPESMARPGTSGTGEPLVVYPSGKP